MMMSDFSIKLDLDSATINDGGPAASPRGSLASYPLLAEVDGEVRTEDGAASAAEIAAWPPARGDVTAIAAHFGTTTEHVRQAQAYVVENPA